MELFCTYFIFLAIGIAPHIFTGHNALDWQWWAVCAPLWVGLWLHDWAILNRL